MIAGLPRGAPDIMSTSQDLIEPLDCVEFGEFLLEKGIQEDVVSIFVTNKVNGSVFLKLSEADLKELIPMIGDQVIVREILKEVCKVSELLFLLLRTCMCPERVTIIVCTPDSRTHNAVISSDICGII